MAKYNRFHLAKHYRSDREAEFASPNPKKFRRSTTNKVIAGICGGLGERFDQSPIYWRIGAVVLMLLGFLPHIVVAYILMWWMTPKKEVPKRRLNSEEEGFWSDVSDRPRNVFSHLKYRFLNLEERLQSLERKATSDEWRLHREINDLGNEQNSE